MSIHYSAMKMKEVFVALLLQSILMSTNATVENELSRQIKLYDGLISVLSTIETSLAAILKYQRDAALASDSINKHLQEQNRQLKAWEETMVQLRQYLIHGDHDIVMKGMPGTTMKGKMLSERFFLNCEGRLPTFCKLRANHVSFKVKETLNYIDPLRGGRRGVV